MPNLYPYLNKIDNPKDVKKMSIKQLKGLCEDVRNRISEVVRETGGHLGPNLGVVEIISACHKVFDLDKDRLVFDVGHQSYPHKLLAERHKHFDSLRQKKGVSGYPHQGESRYDVFRSGHASTAISTSVGISEGFKHFSTKRKNKVIALVGDGSMTGGMAFEGLNHAGHIRSNLIVILNDNRMSISPTVGALSNYLNKVRHNKVVNNVKDEIVKFLSHLPKIGDKLEETANFILEESRTIINPGQIFTILGFDYYGPVNGHDIKELVDTLESVKKQEGPILIHALTDKGRGYRPGGKDVEAVNGPHALSPGTRQKEENKKKNIVSPTKAQSYSSVFVENFIKIASKNKKVVGITAAMPEGTALDVFGKKFPNRYYDVGICEQHATGFAAGLSNSGMRPVFAVYSTFLQRGFDQLFHDIALQADLPVVFCIDRAGLVGDDGPSHHGVYDISYLRVMPGFVLMAPKDGEELRQMMEFAINKKSPVAIRYPRQEIPKEDFFDSHESIVLGMPELLRKGEKICLLAYGAMNENAKLACDELKEHGIKVTLVNARFAKPLNKKYYENICKSHEVIITIEDGTVIGGFGSAVLEMIVGFNSNIKVDILGVPDKLIEHANREEQIRECKMDVSSIVKKVKSYLN